jgi:hypothetical protein
MPSCDKTTCSQPADIIVRYPAGGDTRTYCQRHYEDLTTMPGLEIHAIATIPDDS